jgi:hypothetical protein
MVYALLGYVVASGGGVTKTVVDVGDFIVPLHAAGRNDCPKFSKNKQFTIQAERQEVGQELE